MSENYDVIVIGGGIAGLSTAANITKGSVLLVEKDEIKTEENRYLRSSFIEYPNRFGFSKCVIKNYDTYLLQSLTGKKLEIYFDDYALKLLDLGKINKLLKKEVLKKFEIKEKTKVIDIKIESKTINVVVSDENNLKKTLTAKFVIDASGVNCVTRGLLNLEMPVVLCHCLSATFQDDYIGNSNILTYIMPNDDFRCGGWIFPFNKKDHHFGIADSLSSVKSPYKLLKSTYEKTLKHHIFKDIINGNNLKEWDVGIIPIGYTRPLVFDKIAYVGDSGVQATPWLFEGIRPISEASIFCAKSIDHALKNKNKSLLAQYENRWFSTYGEMYDTHHYKEKWKRTTREWDESLSRMSKIVDMQGKMTFLDYIKHDKMLKKNRDILQNLRSQFL